MKIDKIMQGVMVDELSKDIFLTDEEKVLNSSNIGEILQDDMMRIMTGNVQNSDGTELPKE